jgi:Ricin-type beta-trefoil lectin domain/Lysozyme like domain
MIRQSVIAALTGIIALGAVGAGPAGALHTAAARKAVPGTAASSRPASLVPRATGVRLSAAALATAADRCAAWASQAGFADNGYLAGSLTTAVAIALAESGCDPSACYDDTTGATCARPVRRGDSVDRGAWQINNGNRGISRKCAYRGTCAALAAYGPLSQDGTTFAPWSTYFTAAYVGFLPAAQAAVSALRTGTVTSGLAGLCLGYPNDAVRAAAVLENCGSGTADQQWTVQGSTLRTSGGLCLAASSRRHARPVMLRACSARPLQNWVAHTGAALYNPAAHRCLNDPGAVAGPGAVIGDLACNDRQDQTWFRP